MNSLNYISFHIIILLYYITLHYYIIFHYIYLYYIIIFRFIIFCYNLLDEIQSTLIVRAGTVNVLKEFMGIIILVTIIESSTCLFLLSLLTYSSLLSAFVNQSIVGLNQMKLCTKKYTESILSIIVSFFCIKHHTAKGSAKEESNVEAFERNLFAKPTLLEQRLPCRNGKKKKRKRHDERKHGIRRIALDRFDTILQIQRHL